jgi:hypothetical protein
MKFTKPAIDLDTQIALLRSRGLLVPDEARAKHYLRFVGYYRLAGYSLPFQVNYNADGSHRFLDGVSFDDVLDLYVFDRKLRLAVTDALERIEVAFRAELSQSMSERHGPHWYMIYAQAVTIEVLLKVVSPDTHWGDRLAALLADHPKLRADRLGFPPDWQQRAIWSRTEPSDHSVKSLAIKPASPTAAPSSTYSSQAASAVAAE